MVSHVWVTDEPDDVVYKDSVGLSVLTHPGFESSESVNVLLLDRLSWFVHGLLAEGLSSASPIVPPYGYSAIDM